MKKIIKTGLLGAIIGAIIGTATMLGIVLLSDSNRFAKKIDEYELWTRLDPYHIEATSNKGIKSLYSDDTPEGNIILRQIMISDYEGAENTFNMIEQLDEKWLLLFDIIKNDRLRHLFDSTANEKSEALTLIDFFLKIIPSHDWPNKLDFLTKLGDLCINFRLIDKAKQLLREASKELNAPKQALNLAKNNIKNSQVKKEQPYKHAVQIQKSMPLEKFQEASNTERITDTFELGKFVLFPIIFSAVGFLISILLKPGLEVLGKTVIAPAIAEILGSKNMLNELKKGNN